MPRDTNRGEVCPSRRWRFGQTLCVSYAQHKRCSNGSVAIRETDGYSNWKESESSMPFIIGQTGPSRRTREVLGRSSGLNVAIRDSTF